MFKFISSPSLTTKKRVSIRYDLIAFFVAINLSFTFYPIGHLSAEENITKDRQIVKRHLEPINDIITTKILNSQYKQLALTQSSLVEILEKDQTWQNNAALQSKILENTLAKYFKKLVDDNKLQFTELMFTNNMGELVSAYPKTSDYWQGDEEKFSSPIVTRKLYISLPSWDQSTEYYSIHISIPIIEEQKIYGVIIAGLDVTPEDLLSLDLQELLKLKVQVHP